MRKMTYQQAATCGENLKVRVTPEQSEKLQKAWFAAGKTWADGGDNIYLHPQDDFLFLYDDGELSVSSVQKEFLSSSNKEIELIDDLPQHDFASQQDAWIWVSQGNKAKYIDGTIAGFKDGCLWDFSKNAATDDYCFEIFENWQKYTPPRLIRVNGVEVPAPLESLDGFETVYIAEPAREDKYLPVHAGSYVAQCNRGLCYATTKDAIKRAEAMLKFEIIE